MLRSETRQVIPGLFCISAFLVMSFINPPTISAQAVTGEVVEEGNPIEKYIEFNRTRFNSDGTVPDPGIFWRELTLVQEQKAAMARIKTGEGWSPVGPVERPPSTSANPSHGMGRINCIAFHPTDPRTYWIGAAQGGVWKTTDGGETYIPLTDHLPIIRVSDIAVNPSNPDNIFLAVCDYAYIGVALNTDGRKRHTHYGIGIYKTNNGGITWEPTGMTFEQTGLDATLIRRILFHPTQQGTLLTGGVSGIWKSTDDGDSWSQIHTATIWDIEQDYNNGLVIYATTGQVRNTTQGQETMIKSNDFGLTWQELAIGFPEDGSVGRTEIALTKKNSAYVYVVAADPAGGFYGFWRSMNAGDTWELMNSWANENLNILEWNNGAGTGGQGWYDLAIMVDGKDENKVYVGGINMWMTGNGGSTWQKCSHWVMSTGFTLHADHHQYKYNYLDDMYYACHDGGVDRTNVITPGMDGSGKWNTQWQERSNGMIITAFYRIGLSEMNPGYVVGGAQDNSTFYSRNGDWINFIGGDGMDCMIHPDDPSIIWGSSQYGNLVRSDDGGGGWRGIRPTNSENGGWTTPMALDQNNPNVIFTGYGNVYKSENMGNNWTKISDLPIIQGYGKPAIISALALYSGNSDVIYIAKRMHYPNEKRTSVWRTYDGGHWENVTAGLPDTLYFTSIAVDDNDSLSAWITCGGFSEGKRVYHTRDGGATWDNVSWNLPNLAVNSVVHQNVSDNNIVYVGTDAGVYYTYDGLNEWILYSTHLPNVIVSDLEIHYPSRKLYTGTFGRGVWMTDLVAPASGTHPDGFENSRLLVYPNPAKGELNISVKGVQTHEVEVELVSITGQRMQTWKASSQHGDVTLRLETDVPAGVYFIRVWAGQQVRSERVLIER